MFDTFFNVSKQPVYRQVNNFGVYYEPMPNIRAIVNDRTGQTLSIMSKDYEPVSDEQALTKFLEIFDNADITLTPIKHHVNVSKDGVRGRVTYMEMEIPNLALFPDTLEEQRCRVIIPNSYDGTTALSFRLMYWRLICLNGMMGWKEDFTMKIKHRKGAEDRLQDAIQLYLHEDVYQTQQKIEEMQGKTGLRDNIMLYLQSNPVLPGERWAERLLGNWLRKETTENFWQLYNIFTDEITHSYGKNFGSKLNKMEVLNREVKNWDRLLTTNATQISTGNILI
jgi:hypothetical protein